MTDQKQAPERIIGVLLEGEGSVLIPRSLLRKVVEEKDAAIKQRDELAASEHGLLGRLETCKQDVEKAEAERDQAIGMVDGKSRYDRVAEKYRKACEERDHALASVGAVIEQAKQVALSKHEAAVKWASHHVSNFDGQTDSLRVAQEIEALNPDATAALNEMLADAWDEGNDDACAGWRAGEPNPYRKDVRK